MYQAMASSRTPFFYCIPLSLLFLLALTACTKTVGPRLDRHAVAYKVEKPRVVAKAKQKEPVSKGAKPIKLAEPDRPSKQMVAATPCNMADPGYGIYYPWIKNLEMGRMLMPKRGALTADNGFDVMIHFHGGNAVRKMIADSARGIFVVGIDLGAGSGAYGRPFSDPNVFTNLINDIERGVAEYTGKPSAHIRRLGLTGWSAGYGAIRAILRQKAGKKVDAVVLLDGLHSNYDDTNPSGLRASQLRPFVRFAKSAANGSKFMFVSHSSIIPPGYASTTETAHYLTDKLGVPVRNSSAKDSPLLSRYEQAQSGGFLMRGYYGEGKDDHCAQIALIVDAVSEMEGRWNTPKAEGRRYSKPQSEVAENQTPKLDITTSDQPMQCQEQPKVLATVLSSRG